MARRSTQYIYEAVLDDVNVRNGSKADASAHPPSVARSIARLEQPIDDMVLDHLLELVGDPVGEMVAD